MENLATIPYTIEWVEKMINQSSVELPFSMGRILIDPTVPKNLIRFYSAGKVFEIKLEEKKL